LIHGAAGNVGRYAVQLASDAGIEVIATAGGTDIDTVRGLGANQVVDFRKHPFEEVVRGVDAVIDLVGGDTQTRSFVVVKPGGKLVSAVSKPDQDLASKHKITAAFFLVDVTTECLEQIAAKFERGSLKANVGKVLPLAEAKLAHEMLQGSLPRPGGKIALDVDV